MGIAVKIRFPLGVEPRLPRFMMGTFPSILVIFLCLSTFVSARDYTNKENAKPAKQAKPVNKADNKKEAPPEKHTETVTCKGGTKNNVCVNGVCTVTCQDGSQVNINCKNGSISMNNNEGNTQITCGPPVKLAPCFPWCDKNNNTVEQPWQKKCFPFCGKNGKRQNNVANNLAEINKPCFPFCGVNKPGGNGNNGNNNNVIINNNKPKGNNNRNNKPKRNRRF